MDITVNSNTALYSVLNLLKNFARYAKMKYIDEYAAVRLAVKKAKRSGINAGFSHIMKYANHHPEDRDIAGILKCYRKAVKKGIC